MISYILIFLSSLSFLSSTNNKKIEKKIYSVIFTAALFSYSILGLVSLILINLDRSRFPLIIISSLIFLSTIFFNKNSFKDFAKTKQFLLSEFIQFKDNFSDLNQKKSTTLICILIFLITLSSIGPINHPDALDYHVGYPYQYWLRGDFFIDGGLHQALMGAGDYANLAFIQGKVIWLIRYIQISNLPLICLFFINNIKNKFSIIAFLSILTFIQWSTIGKPLFLSESSCAIAYIIWKEYKDHVSRKLLLICIISCISIKISSLIVCTPIIIDIVFDIFSNKKNNLRKKINILKKIFLDKSVLLSLLLLITILYSRYIIIGNFAFPLLTNIFNKNDILINNFAEYLSSYRRDGLFPLNIFLPISFNNLASSLGPGIFLILLLQIFEIFKNNNKKRTLLFCISMSQIILLIFFCQGRADYYVLPIILAVYSSDNLNEIYKNKFLKFSLNLSIFFQLILIIAFLLFSIKQNIFSILDYEKTMISTSYGFDFSRLIKTKSSGNFYQNIIRDSRFFYPSNYISREMMQRCTENNPQNYCFKKYDISQIITAPNFVSDKRDYNCYTKEFISGSRNPLNRKKGQVEICEKISLSK